MATCLTAFTLAKSMTSPFSCPLAGCLATVHIKAKDRGGKLRPAADAGVYLGHGERSDGGLQGYRVYKYATNKVVIRHDVSFNCTLPAMQYISTVTATSADAQFLNVLANSNSTTALLTHTVKTATASPYGPYTMTMTTGKKCTWPNWLNV